MDRDTVPEGVGLLTAAVGADGRVVAGSDHAIVPWWSFTKTLLAACVLRLAEQGRIALDAPPGLRMLQAGAGEVASREMPRFTVRQLLQHRAGIGNYGELPGYHAAVAAGGPAWSDETLFRQVPPTALLHAPGERFRYSNVGYLLLRRLVEQETESSLAEALERLVLRPLGLSGCRVAARPEDLAGLALPVPAGYDPGWVFHGLVIGPVAQAALALHSLFHGGLLSAGSLAEMTSALAVGGPLAGRPWVRPGYGLGVMSGAMAESVGEAPSEVLGHSAGGPGSSGAVYTAAAGAPATAAAFTAGKDEGPAEFVALGIIRRLQDANQLAT